MQVCLLADVIQHFVDQKLDFDCTYVYEDVQRSIKFIHRSGNLHREILSNPAKYLQKNVCSRYFHLYASLYEQIILVLAELAVNCIC